jgi:hypothetical protein
MKYQMDQLKMNPEFEDSICRVKEILRRNEEMLQALSEAIRTGTKSELVKARAQTAVRATRALVRSLNLDAPEDEVVTEERPRSPGTRRRWNRGRQELFEQPRNVVPFGQ